MDHWSFIPSCEEERVLEEKLSPLFHPSISLSSLTLFLSFFSLFFHKSRPQSGYRNRLETDEIPRVSATSFRVSPSTLSPDNIRDTLWIISGRMVDIETCFLARLLNGGSGSPFRSRLWKHDHCKMSENAVSAVIVRSPRLCKDGIGGRIL